MVTARGREIKFFEPFCRGVSAGQEEDAKAQREKENELRTMQKTSVVIVLTCNPLNVF